MAEEQAGSPRYRWFTEARYDAMLAVNAGLYPALRDSMHALADLRDR